MAIAFAQSTIHSRAKGHSAVAAIAYRSGSRFTDERTGIVYDFTKRTDVIFTELLLPENATEAFKDRGFLWNQVEFAEKRKDAQVCKDIMLALPKELDLTNQIELAKRFAHTHFVSNGIPADVAIHDHGDGNPHAHILISTRRLEKNGFSYYKARDLNPVFSCGKIVEKDYWGELWRDEQEGFFKERGIDLSVDLNHVISERHEGKVRCGFETYKQEENRIIKEERIHFTLNNIDNLINHISLTTSVFTRRDLEKLVFKTFNFENSQSDYLTTIEKVLSHKSVIALGANDEGREAYTTRDQYLAESRLLSQIEILKNKKSHVFETRTSDLANQYALNEEQTQALDYIATGNDISVLIGRPGVGKSYLLKPLREYYENHGRRVIGTALSGKVAKALHAETGIESHTLAALTYRLQNNKLALTNKDILLLDEAGMVDFSNMAYVVDTVLKAGAKLVLVGDPNQLKPIEKGEILRGIAAHTGYIEMDNIRRQRDLGDREASVHLSKGDIENAINHYADKGAIHFHDYASDAGCALVHDWSQDITALEDIKEKVMFAFSRSAVLSLNEQARVTLIEKGLVQEESFIYGSEKDKAGNLAVNDTVILRFNDETGAIKSGMTGQIKSIDNDTIAIFMDNETIRIPSFYASKLSRVESGEIAIAVGDRILLRQNDANLGVRNGDFAFVESVNAEQITARLDSGEVVTLPKSYKRIEYGYATTVHKGQGLTVEDAYLHIDSKYWDKHLANVGMTRHKNRLNMYVDTHQHADVAELTKTLSRSTTKDNVIDWPLNFAIRAGFNPDSLIGRAINHVAGVVNTVQDKWNYIAYYSEWLKNKSVQYNQVMRAENREQAKNIADFYDRQSVFIKENRAFQRIAQDQEVDHAIRETFYNRSLALDKEAHSLWTDISKNKEGLDKMPIPINRLERSAERYARFLTIEAIATMDVSKADESLQKRAAELDLDKNRTHIKKIAKANNLSNDVLFDRIETLQTMHIRRVFGELKKEHPVLSEYEKIAHALSDANHLQAEKLQKAMDALLKSMVKDKAMMQNITTRLPSLAKDIQEEFAQALDRDRGIEH